MVRTALVLLTFASISLSAQNQTTSRTTGNYVRLDVYASRDGQAVDDLTRDEVEVLEDGTPQTVDKFEHVSVSPSGSSGAHARVFIVFLDTYHTQIEGSSNLRVPLIKLLDRVIGSDDMVAVVTPEMSVSEITFGRKAALISNIMQADWSWARRGRTDRKDQKEELYDSCFPPVSARVSGPAPEMIARRRERMTLAALDELVSQLSAPRDERKAILTISEGWPLFRENRNLMASTGGGRADQSKPGDVFRPRQRKDDGGSPTGINRVECETDRMMLAGVDHSLRLRELAENANRSNITFYTVSPRGLLPSDAPASREAAKDDRDGERTASRQDSLRFIADNTDGISIQSASNIEASIDRIVSDVSSYYLVGYSSSNTKLDGRFRSITVRVKREGVKARTRRGYRGRTAEDLVSSNGGSTGSVEDLSALLNTRSAARSPFRIRTSSWLPDSQDGNGQGAFWIVGELNYQTRRQLAWTAGAQADVVVMTTDGTELVSRTVDVRAGDGPFGIQVPETGTIGAGEYAVRVRLRSQADDKAEFTDTARVVLDGRSSLGEAVMWRRGPSTGPQYMRTADPRFLRSDRLRLELATSAKTPAQARLLDRNGNPIAVPVQVSERPDPSGAFTWVVVDAVLAPFAMGDYAAEVTQGQSKRVTPFSIIP